MTRHQSAGAPAVLIVLAAALLLLSSCDDVQAPGDDSTSTDDDDASGDDDASDDDSAAGDDDDSAAGDDDDTAAGDDDSAAGDDDDSTAGDDDDSAAGDDDDSAAGDDDDTAVEPPDAPTVEGELSAGHYRPTWLWTTPGGSAEFRYRVDTGTWNEVAVSTLSYTPPTDLSTGVHSFEVQAGDGTGINWSSSGSFTTTIEFFSQDSIFWNGVERDLATSPQGHVAAVACHNCYEDGNTTPATNFTETISAIDAAVADEADLIELDVKFEGATWFVGHDDDGSTNGASLADVLVHPSTTDIDQPLFIEIKETAPTSSDLEALLFLLTDNGYMTNGRPVILRTFLSRINNLIYAKNIVDSGALPLHENYIRYSVLYDTNEASTVEAFQDLLTDAQAYGYHMVEFNRSTDNLFGLLTWARSLDLGTNIWTIPVSMGEAYCAFFRNEVEAITTDYDVGDCREVVEDDTSLVYLNAWSFSGGASSIDYNRTDDSAYSLSTGGTNEPSVVFSAQGEDLYGGYLNFVESESDYLSTYDADTNSGEGYFAGVVINFDTLNVPTGDTKCILNKADSGGFAFEIQGEATGDVLRFGVHVNGSYHYATYPMANFNNTDSYYLIGAYDGDGAVRLWVDGSTSGTNPTSPMTGGVTANDSPVVLAADPQGTSATRWYTDNKIQMVTLQSWANH